MAVQIQLRRDSAADWASANPVLALGEPGVETDTLKVKVGDGSTAWNSLAYSITTQFADLNGKPTTLAGYGITDGGGDVTAISTTTFTNKSGNISQWTNDSNYLTSVPAQSFSSLTGKPTTVAGYGITDAFDGAYGSLSGTPTLGTAAATASTAYATAAQGTTADSAIQPNTSPTLTNATLTGYLAGPASFVIDPAAVGDDTGTVVIAGNLQVDGTQTTINSTTVAIDDLNFSIATDAADSAAANGAGISIGGAGATLVYTHATTSWDLNKQVNISENLSVGATPKAMQSGFDNIQVGGNLTLNVDSTGAGAGVYMGNNVYRDVTNSRWEYIYTDEASQYVQANGEHIFRQAVSGTANDAITWTTPLKIDASGNVGIGTDPSQIFEVQKAADDKLVYGSNPRLVLDTPTGINGLRVLGDTTPFEFKIDSGTYNGSAFSMGGTGDVSLLGTTTTASDTFNDSPTFFFNSMRWNGSANATHFQGAIKGHTRSATNGDGYLGIGASASANHLNIDASTGYIGIGTTTPVYEFDHNSNFSGGETKVYRRRYDEVVVAYNGGTSGAGTSTVTVTLSVVGLRGVVLTADFSGSRNNSGPDNYMTRICHALMSESTNLRRSDRLTGLEFAVGSTPVTVSSVAMSSDNIVVTYSIAPNGNAYDARMLFTAKGPGIQDVDVSVSFA